MNGASRNPPPWLDGLVEFSGAGRPWESFARMQALWFQITDAIRAHLTTMPIREVPARWARALRSRRLTAPVRVVEALRVRDSLHADALRR